jgi:outer membrane protein assembly factor BamB
VADVDGDSRPEIAVTSDNIGDITRQRYDPLNVNEVALIGWRNGKVDMLRGWPRHTRDATLGLAMADLDGDGRAEILAACGQDIAPAAMRATGTWLVSRLYVWSGDGSAVAPWYPVNEDTWQGLAYGHAYAAPLITDLNGDGRLEVLHASQGVWEGDAFQNGSLRLYSASGALLARTQTDFAALPWYALKGFAMDSPAVIADLNGDGRHEVVAATYDGHLYAWTAVGSPIRGWFPADRASTELPKGTLIRGGIAAADINGDGRDEVIAGGYDGALYCWSGSGRLLWRTVCGKAPLTSGVAVGRLRRGTGEVDAVAGDAAGVLTVCNPNGAIRWRFAATPGSGIFAEPAIGDVNGDGTQDVVVGGTDGYVYALDGESGTLLWQVPTCAAPTQEGMRFESIFGAPALCDLRGNGHLNVVIATGQRYIADVPSHTWKGFGHVIILDCGPGTYNATKIDWPQYRENAGRTGHLAPPGDPR